MRKSRIGAWIFLLLVALGLYVGESWITDKFLKEKAPLYVYAPDDMEEAFKTAMKFSDMKSDYKIVMTEEKKKANIIVETGKEFNQEYERIAFSPFVVAYAKADDNVKKLRNAEVLSETVNSQIYSGEIDVLTIIEEVINESQWEVWDIKNEGEIKVYYPHRDTQYWNDFYDFMLVTVNGGQYPKTEEELIQAIDKINKFEESKCAIPIKDIIQEVGRNNSSGFMKNAFYVLPEKIIFNVITQSSNTMGSSVFYPTTTVYFNYYIKVDELGSRLVKHFEEDDSFEGMSFYDKLGSEAYRTSFSLVFPRIGKLYGLNNPYDVVYLEKDRIKPVDVGSPN